MTFMFLIETFDPLMQGCSISPTPITFAMISRHYKDVNVIIFNTCTFYLFIFDKPIHALILYELTL